MHSTVGLAKTQPALRLGRCPECQSVGLVTDTTSGEIVCNHCGLVTQTTLLTEKAEWRAFTPQERAAKRRVGPTSTFSKYDKGLSTSFQPYKDTSGKTLPRQARIQMLRLQKQDTRAKIHSSHQRNLSKALTELNRLGDKLHLPKMIKEEAARLYRKTLKEGLVRGRAIPALVAAALYAACRLTRTPRSLKTVAEVSPRSRSEISRCYRLIQRKLELKIPVDGPAKYVSRIASRTGVAQRTQNRAIQLLTKAKQRRAVSGKDPKGLAAAALYLAITLNGERITQIDLAEAAGVTEVTVRNRYKGLRRSLGLLIKNDGANVESPNQLTPNHLAES